MKRTIQIAVLALLAGFVLGGCKEKASDETVKESDAINKGLEGLPPADPEAADPMGSMQGGGKPGGNRAGGGP